MIAHGFVLAVHLLEFFQWTKASGLGTVTTVQFGPPVPDTDVHSLLKCSTHGLPFSEEPVEQWSHGIKTLPQCLPHISDVSVRPSTRRTAEKKRTSTANPQTRLKDGTTEPARMKWRVIDLCFGSSTGQNKSTNKMFTQVTPVSG